jgi:glycosyltransferase involved in cell wall biosynthesis
MRFSLIIPCYNEAANLPGLVTRCRALVEDATTEVILVDNGSSDATPEVLDALVADQPRIRSVRVAVNRGYGHGILSGLRHASGDVLGWTHADHQTDPVDARAAIALFVASADPERLFVKGLRYGRPALDVAFTGGMSMFETMLSGHVMRDINAQPTLFHRKFYETWRNPPDDFALDLFAYWRAREAALTIRRIPVRFGPRAYGVSHWNSGLAARLKFVRRTLDYSLRLRRSLDG